MATSSVNDIKNPKGRILVWLKRLGIGSVIFYF
jgi:hypothetical protein